MSEHQGINLSQYRFDLVLSERTLPLNINDRQNNEEIDQYCEARLMASRLDDSAPPIEAGKIVSYVLRIDRIADSGDDLCTSLDDISGDLWCCWKALFRSKGYDLKPSVEDLLGTPMSSKLLYFERLEVSPPFRGKQLGLAMLRTLMANYPLLYGLAVLIAKPLESGEIGLDRNPRGREFEDRIRTPQCRKAEKRLGQYYERLGFKRIPRSNVYAFNLENRLPELKIPGLD